MGIWRSLRISENSTGNDPAANDPAGGSLAGSRRSRRSADKRRAERTHRRNGRVAQRRESTIERFEDRCLLTAGPQLISIIPDNGGLLLPGETLNAAPHELTFRFDQNQVIDPNTLNGIELTRSGGDGVFGNSNDLRIFPGFIGVGPQLNEVEMRFDSPLPDDLYQITIVGAGPNALTNTPSTGDNGQTIGGNPFNGGVNYSQDFRLDLGPQVLATVPQPVSAPDPTTGVRTQAKNEIDVYFNESLDPQLATNPALYQLISTKNTSTTADDSVAYPTKAIYVAANDEVRLQFFDQQNNPVDIGSFAPNGSGALRLRIGNTAAPQQAPIVVQVPADPDNPATPTGTGPGDTFSTAMQTGTLNNGQTELFDSSIDPLPVNPGLTFPGGDTGPGQQNLPQPLTAGDLNIASGTLSALAAWVQSEGVQNHLLDGRFTSPGGVVTIPYNFQDIYGADTANNFLHNSITPAQKQAVREIFGLFSYYSGVNFVETPNAGITVATGDIRAVSPSDPPTAVNGVEGPTKTSNGGPVVVVNGNVNWGQSEYGGSYFRVAMNEIGHALGLGNNYDQPGSIMGPAGYEDASQPAPTADTTQMFPGNADISHLQFLYRTDSKDVDLYKYTVTQSGTLNAETLAQRLTPTSQLNTVLSLYDEVTLLGVPAGGGQAVSDGETFSITATTAAGSQLTRTFEFNSGISISLPGTINDGSTFQIKEGSTTVTYEFVANGRALAAGDTNVPIRYNVTDPVNTVAGDVVQAINLSVKNSPGLAASRPAIVASYSGGGVINIGGDANTSFQDVDSGTSQVKGSQATLSDANHVMVRFAPSESQHDLAVAIANAIGSPVLDVGTANQVSGEQFTFTSGVLSKTFELDIGTNPNLAPGVVQIMVSAGDSATTVANAIANAVNTQFGAGTASSFNNHVTFSSGSVTSSADAQFLSTLNVIATPELTQVQLQGPLTVSLPANLTTAGFTQAIQRNLISRNDDYFGRDSFIGMSLEPGVYYIGVSSTGNTQFDPNIHDSGWGGTTDGMYELRLNFQADAATQNSLVSAVAPIGQGLNALGQDTPQPLDGDGDGVPGGTYNFWFNVAPDNSTIFVDKTPPSSPQGPLGSLGNPFTTIQAALNANPQPGSNLRIEGNGGASLGIAINQAPAGAEVVAGQNFSISAGPTSATLQFFQMGGDALEVGVANGLGVPDGATFSITQGKTTVTFEFARNSRVLTDGNVPINYLTTDSASTLANKIISAINGAVTAKAFGSGPVPINATFAGTAADGHPVINVGGDVNTNYSTTTGAILIRRAGTGSFVPYTGRYAIEVTATDGNSIVNGSKFSISQGARSVTFEFTLNGQPLAAGDNNTPISYLSTDLPGALASEIAQAIQGAIAANKLGALPTTAAGAPVVSVSYAGAASNGNPVIEIGGDTNTSINLAAGGLALVQGGIGVSPLAPGAVLIDFQPTDSSATVASAVMTAIQKSPLGQVPPGAATASLTAKVTNDSNYYYVKLAQGQFRLVVNTATAPFNVPVNGATPALYTDIAYQIGTNNAANNNAPLADGATFNVPKGVTVMIDPGAEFKMRQSIIDVGSSAQNIDRSEGALQVLGIPGNQVIFTSFNDDTVGGKLETPPTAPARGDWGGLVFRNDSDLEPLGIFLNYVDEASLRYGGGQVTVNGTPAVFDSVDLETSRPTVTNNTILDSADAPISANPNSFEETHFQQDITLLAASGDKIVDGQTFQIHGTTFEFDNLNAPQGIGVLPGDIAVRYYGTPANNANPHSVDTAGQVASAIAVAINGASLTAPAVQAAVTGNQVTITNVAMNSAVALNVPADLAKTVKQAILGGNPQTFAIKGTVFEFFNGDALAVDVASGAGIPDGTTFSIAKGANLVTFEFALDNRQLGPVDNSWPINYTAGDSTDTLGREIAQAINAAATAGKFGATSVVAASYSGIDATGHGIVSLSSDGSTVVVAGGPVTYQPQPSGQKMQMAPNDVAVYFQGGYSSLQMAQSIAAAIDGAQLDGGTGELVYAEAVLDSSGAARVDLMNSSDVNLSAPGSAPLSLSLLTPLSVQTKPGSQISDGDGFTVNGQLFEFDQGTTITVPRVGGLAGPVSLFGNPIVNGDSFTINDGNQTKQFVFFVDGNPTGLKSNQVPVLISSFLDTPQDVADKIAKAINGATVANAQTNPNPLVNIKAFTTGVRPAGTPPSAALLNFGQVRIVGTAGVVPAVSIALAPELTSTQLLHGGTSIPFAPAFSATTIAQAIGTVVSGAGLGVSANANGSTVTFENADSVVPHPMQSQYANVGGNAFTFGTDLLPLGLLNNFYTADYARLGPDVHGNTLAVRNPQTLTVTTPANVADGQQFVISNVGFEFDNNAATAVGFHAVTFTAGQTADQLAQDMVNAINQASDPTNPLFVPGFNVHALLGPAGSGQVILLQNAPASFNFSGSLGTFQDTVPLNTVPVRVLGATPLAAGQKVIENTINGLFVRIRTNAGQSLDTLDVTARFHDTDIPYVITENLVLSGQPGGPLGAVGRPSARLQVDPGVIVKLLGSHIEVGMGANLVAEGDQNHQVTFTSLFDDTVGAGGTFFTNGDDQNPGGPQAPSPGDWGGIYFAPTSTGSLDYVALSYAGGLTPIEGSFANFDAIEIHQAEVRITNSTLSDNASGFDTANSGRNGRGLNTAAVIFVENAQPVIANNVIQDNNLGSSAIDINADSFTANLVPDWGRSTGPIDTFTDEVGANYGPLVRLNKIGNTSINGMVVRGGTLTTDTVWDDTDIVHVVQSEIKALNNTTVRLQSTATQSLVVKLEGGTAGLTASGVPSNISDRIGGTLQVLGQPGHPVVFTALTDCNIGAGLTPQNSPQNDTDNGNCGVMPSGGSGAVFVDGGDRDDHGFFDGQNEDGWKFIQQAMNFVYQGSRNTSGSGILVIGAIQNRQAGDAVTSAAKALGLQLTFVTGAQITTANFEQYKAIYVPSDAEDTFGGISDADLALLTARKSDIQTYVNQFGGSLMALTEANSPTPYTWMQLPDPLTIQTYTAAGNLDPLAQTPALSAAGFNITDTEINAGTPWHNSFTGPPGFNNMIPFVKDALTGEVVTLGLPPGSSGIGGTGAAAGTWNTLKFDEYANDNNVAVSNEVEPAYTGGNDTNGIPNTAEPLGSLAPNLKSGDDNLRLGFQVNGFISPNDPHDVDTYSFTAQPGTQVWLQLGNTAQALDGVLELVDANGNVLARSDNGVLEQADAIKAGNPLVAGPLLTGLVPGNLAQPMQSSTFQNNVYAGPNLQTLDSINPRDPGMRLTLPGTPNPSGQPTTYYVRVYSKGAVDASGNPIAGVTYMPNSGPALNKSNGISSGTYQLQVRLQQQWQTPGSVVRFGQMSFAKNGITVLGQPGHSPLLATTTSTGTNNTTVNIDTGKPGDNQSQYTPGQGNGIPNAQDLGNLLTTDSSSISTGGTLNNPGQVDWYKFQLNYNLQQAIQGVNAGDKTWATVFHVGYADGLGRPDTTISVFDQWGHLIYSGRDSNVADSQPTPTKGTDQTNLNHGSFGTGDPYIGSVQLPAGYVNNNFPGPSATYPLPAGTYGPPLQTANNYDGPNGFTYFVAISSNATLPVARDATFSAGSANPLVRLEPADGYQRIVEDHIGFTGYTSSDSLPGGSTLLGNGTQIKPQDGPLLPVQTVADLQQNVRPFSLNDVVLYVNTESHLYTDNPANGIGETDVGALPGNPFPMGDITIRTDGKMFGYSEHFSTDADTGHLWSIDPGNAASTNLGGDGAAGKWGTSKPGADALTYVRTGTGTYKLFFAAEDPDGTSHLLYANPATGDTTATPPYFDMGSILTGGQLAPVNGAILDLHDNPLPPGQPQSTNFTITDLAGRTLNFAFEEVVEPNGAPTPQPIWDPNSLTETIFYQKGDNYLTVSQNVSQAINNAFFSFSAQNPPPNGLAEPSAQIVVIKQGSNTSEAVTITDAAATDFSNAPEFTQFGDGVVNVGPGGFVTGMAYDISNNTFVVVTNTGGVYSMPVDGAGFPELFNIQYLAGSSVFTKQGDVFDGLSLGPQNLDWNGDGTPGDLKNTVFAVYHKGPIGGSGGFGFNGAYGQSQGQAALLTAISDTALGANNIFSPQPLKAGAPLSVFDSFTLDSNGRRTATGGYVDHVPLLDPKGNPLTDVTGLALSPLDFNLWHPTFAQSGTPGHGISSTPPQGTTQALSGTPDNSRTGAPGVDVTWQGTGAGGSRVDSQTAGGASYYFGVDGSALAYQAPGAQYGVTDGKLQADLMSNPNIANTYNLPGGAYGTLTTDAFSLAGYSAADKPTLYFNYSLDSGMTSNSTSGWKSSARVFASTDGGRTWDEVATNNPAQTVYDPSNDPRNGSIGSRQVALSDAGASELPDVITASSDVPATTLNGKPAVDPRQQVQQLFDGTGSWRQARIDLGNYAGQSNIMLRFDFSTSGAIGQGLQLFEPGTNPNDGPFAYKSESGHFPPDSAQDHQTMQGDQFGNPGSNTRGQNNQHNGWFIDDIIVGLAERGEMVTGAPVAQTSFFTTPQNPNFGAPTEILTGPYQLDIRQGTPTGASVNPNRASTLTLPNQLDVNDRQTSGYTLIAPETHFNQSLTETPGKINTTTAQPPVFTYIFNDVPNALADGTLILTAVGDLEGTNEYLNLDFPDLPSNSPIRQQLQQNVFFTQQDKGLQGQFYTSTPISLTQAELAALITAGKAANNGKSVIRITATPEQIGTPTLNPITTSPGGNLAANTTYYYKITAITDTAASGSGQLTTTSNNGETAASNEHARSTTLTDQTLDLSWTAVPGAQGYKIYRGTASGNENVLVAVTNGAATTYNDAGGATTPATPPTVGTTQQVNGIANLTTTLDYSTAGDGATQGLGIDGQTFTISDGVHQRVFEFDDNNQLSNPSNIRVAYSKNDTSGQIAQDMVAAINQAGLISVYAATDDANSNSTSASNTPGDSADRVNLFGAAWVQVGTPQQVVSGPSPANSTNPPVASVSTITTAFNTNLNSATPGVFNGYGVIGNAAGIGTSPQVDLMKVYLHAGDGLTIDLSTQSINSPLKPMLRLFDASGNEFLSSQMAGAQLQETQLQDAGQLPFLSRQFDSNGQNIYLPPPVGQPGSQSDLYYTFTAVSDGFYYVGVSGQGNNKYNANNTGPATTRGSTGFYQIQLSAGPINLRGTSLQHGDAQGFFRNLPDNQKLPPDNNVNIGTLFYRSPDMNSETAGTLPSGVGFAGQGVNDTTVRVVKYDNMQGDTEVVRPQGTIILQSNLITNSLNDGILVSSSPREGLVGTPNSNLPHQGGVVNLPVLNNARLVPGAAVSNNIVTGFGHAGIEFDGDSSGPPAAAVPFGRIVNNTVYGATTPAGTGILVQNNASPSVLNNIVANTAMGISIDASSLALPSPPVLGENLYQGNTNNTNLNTAAIATGDPGTNGIVLKPTDPLFVNAAAGNFYLQEFSKAIDSSINTLQDRAAMTQVTAPVGIAPSPIVAPATDINGQLRVDDPNVSSPPGLGQNVFKDRGAVERADVSGPLASLLTPADNNIADQDPRVNFVHPVGQNISEFDILINDGIGSGVDNSTVTQDRVTVRRNGVLLTPGLDYAFVYDNNNHIIRLIAASGVWQNGNVYDIALDNGTKFDPQDPTLGPAANDAGITDLAGNSLQANAPSGYTSFELILDSIQNDAPAIITPTAAQTMFEHQSLAFTPTPTGFGAKPNAISVFDVDANGGAEQVTITASIGTLTAPANVPGVTVTGDGSAANPLVIKGPLGSASDPNNPGINTVLAGLVFHLDNPADLKSYYFNGVATLTIVANDLGNTPSPAKITTTILPITVVAVNDPPVDTVPSGTQPIMDFPAGSAATGLTFRLVNSGTGATTDFAFGNQWQVAVAAGATQRTIVGQTITLTQAGVTKVFQFANPWQVNIAFAATGNSVAHQTFTVNLAGVSKTFEFITPTSGPVSPTNIAISVNDTDNAFQLAQAAATVVSGAAGFSTPGLATASGFSVSITAPTSVPASDTQLTLKDPGTSPNVPIAINANATPGQMAQAAAATIDGNTGFNNPNLASANGDQIFISSQPNVTGDSLLDLFLPVPFKTTDSSAAVAADVATAINANVPGASAGNSGNRVTLAGGAWQFAALVGTTSPNNPSTEDNPYVFSAANGNGVTVTDPDIFGTDINNSALQFEEVVSVVSGSGTLNVTNSSGITFVNSTGPNSSTLDFQGTLAAINQALEGLIFTPSDEYVGPVDISFLTNDHGNIGVGPAPLHAPAPVPLNSLPADVHLAILRVIDAPTLNNSVAMHLNTINEQSSHPPTPAPSTVNVGNSVFSILQTGANSNAMTATAPGARFGIAITGLTVPSLPSGAAGGTWQYSLDGGKTWLNLVPGPAGVAGSPAPSQPTVANAAGGSLASNTTYYYMVTAINGQGESAASAEAAGTTSGSNNTLAVSWAAVAGATGYKVYRGTAPGAENTLIATISGGASTLFNDNGTEATSAVISPTNALLLDGGNGTTTFGDYVRFSPAQDFNSTAYGTPAINFVAWDQTAALNPNTNALVALTHGQTVDLNAADGVGIGTGGSTPFSVYSTNPNTLGTATITVTAVNDVPSIKVAGGAFNTLESTPLVFQGASAPVITDFDIGEGSDPLVGQLKATLTVGQTQGTLTVSSSVTPLIQNGTLTVLGNGTNNLVVQGPLADVNAALNGLTFTPVKNFAGPATIRIVADDLGNAGLGGDQTASANLLVSVTAVHQAPVLDATAGQPTFPSIFENISPASNTGSSVGAMLTSIDPNDIYFDGQPTVNQTPPPPNFLDLDADAGAKQGIAITAINNQNGGTWQYSLDGGSQWVTIDPGSVATNRALLLPGSSFGDPGAFVRFQPNTNFTGTVSLTFHAWDQTSDAAATHVNLSASGSTGGNTAYSTGVATASLTVTTVNQPPSFSLHNYTTTEDDTVVDPAAGKVAHRNNGLIVVPNFAYGVSPGVQGETVSFNVSVDAADQNLFLQQPQIDPNGTLTFQLAPDVFGMATLTVTASNNGSGNNTSNPKTTTISVTGINDPPTIDPISDITVAQNPGQQVVQLTGITAGLNESQVITVTASSSNPSLVPNPSVNYTSPNSVGTLTFTPTAGDSGTATITVTVTDNGATANGGVNTVSETFTVTVGNVGAAPTATPQSVTVTENSQATITLKGTPAPGQTGPLSATITSLPANGTLYQTADGSTLGEAITAPNTAVTNASNEVIYVPVANQTASDSFGFTMTGGNPAATSPPATVSISVAQPGQNPSFTISAQAQANENSGPQSFANFATNISAGTGGSGQSLTFNVTGDSNPSLFSTPPAISANGTLTFTPASGQIGSATITVVLARQDGAQSPPQSFTVTVTGVFSTPTANPDVYVLSQSSSSSASAAVGVLANDTSNDGNPLRAVITNQPLYGKLTLNADGSFTYTPGPAFSGLDRFSYEAQDGSAVSTPVTVTLISYQASIVDKLYHQVLNRAADDAGLQYWTGRIMQGQPYSIIAQGIFESNERLDPIISQYYRQFLLREADAQGLAYWRDQVWKRDGGPENVVAGMISSPEFYRSAGNTNSGWVTALYQRLLNRQPDAQGLQYWTSHLDNGTMTRPQVVLGFEDSKEQFGNDVTGFFQQYLNRQPTPNELNTYVAQMQAGASQRQIEIELIDLPEYRNTPPAPASGAVNRLVSL